MNNTPLPRGQLVYTPSGKIRIHRIETARVLAAINARNTARDNPGFCLACGEDADGCEPDARGYKCEVCDSNSVYGAEEVLTRGLMIDPD